MAVEGARQALAQAVEALEGPARARLLVRINAEGSPWHTEDLRALAQLVEQGVAGAVVSKAERAQTLHAVAQAAGAQAALLPLIESVAGLDVADALAAAPQVVRLAFGHLDFQVDAGMQCEPDEAELLPVRLALILASRRGGLARAVDGVTIDTKDAARLESDTRRALRMGFGAKLCIHPDQVGTVEVAVDLLHAGFQQRLHAGDAAKRIGRRRHEVARAEQDVVVAVCGNVRDAVDAAGQAAIRGAYAFGVPMVGAPNFDGNADAVKNALQFDPQVAVVHECGNSCTCRYDKMVAFNALAVFQ
ncbi:hypothetical protein SDC9_125846 [bioreactor metagenome]|uniref:HpcH/HpaI aldolase/citrate lyase domain-containing protein n=1 Tax=bioreactor metagenome TaxID=1076179 RepID=A0A645CPJ5_9ZZZZ